MTKFRFEKSYNANIISSIALKIRSNRCLSNDLIYDTFIKFYLINCSWYFKLTQIDLTSTKLF